MTRILSDASSVTAAIVTVRPSVDGKILHRWGQSGACMQVVQLHPCKPSKLSSDVCACHHHRESSLLKAEACDTPPFKKQEACATKSLCVVQHPCRLADSSIDVHQACIKKLDIIPGSEVGSNFASTKSTTSLFGPPQVSQITFNALGCNV